MRVYVAEIRPAELEQVVALDPRQVVPVHIVMPIPETGAHVLVVGIVRAEQRTTTGTAVFTSNFKSRWISGDVWHAAGVQIGPPVSCIAEVKVVRKARTDILGQTRSIEPGVLWLLPDRGILSFGVSWEEATDVPLVRNSLGQLVVVIRSVKVVTLREVVVKAHNAEVATLWRSDGAGIAAIVQPV